MWPYDFFNAYSGIMNEFDAESIDSQTQKRSKKVFLAKWYGFTKKEIVEEDKKEKKVNDLISTIDKNIILFSDKSKNKISDRLRYRLKVVMPKKTKMGDINIDILGKIIESSLVICDITPIGYTGFLRRKPIFCPNVMGELGLALAWKMPEQVIVIYDKKFSLKSHKLPFGIQGYFVQQVDFNNLRNKGVGDLKDCIEKRLDDLEFKKNELIKNVSGKLDSLSLTRLENLSGLTFADKHVDYDIGTIRYWLDLGLIRVEIFPPNPNLSWGYYFTDFGRIILLKKLGLNKLFPKEFAELIRIAFWQGHKDQFEKKKKEYDSEHDICWDESAKLFRQILLGYGVKEDEQIINMYDVFRKDKSFENIMNKVVEPWQIKVVEIIERNKQK